MNPSKPATANPYTAFTFDQLTATPWKNGGGVTREIACVPPGAGMTGFDWRVSIADISASGPFSQFDGIDRVIVLLDGPGVRLHSASTAVDHRLDTPLAPFAFAGEEAIDCDLLGGASRDFNVMTRRGVVRSEVTVLTQHTRLEAGFAGLLFAVKGTWLVTPEQPAPPKPAALLAPDAGLWWADRSLGWTLQPQAGSQVQMTSGQMTCGQMVCVQFTRP